MNAIDPNLQSAPAPPPLPLPAARRAEALARGIALGLAAAAAVLAAAPALWPVRGLSAVMMAGLLPPLTGAAAAWQMARARRKAASPPAAPTRRRPWAPAPDGDPGLIGRTARWPQAVLVAAMSLLGTAAAWERAAADPPALIFAGAAIVLTFPLLILERSVAAMPPARLPEAHLLRPLLLLPVLAWPLAGLGSIAAGFGLPTALIDTGLMIVLSAVTAELALRSIGRLFLPPPPATVLAAIDYLLARLIADGHASGGLSATVRRSLGIDFSRSWALSFVRAAAAPVALCLLLLAWGLTGVAMVPADRRAVYERFGAPAAVLGPGLHAVLPWPMGRLREVEFGTVHDVPLGGAAPSFQRTAAEDAPPPDADRLWEQAHPSELTFLIASAGSFQAVSADISLRYRTGLSDRDAVAAAYGVADPAALLRAVATRATGAFFAARTLDAVLGANREAMADLLRAGVQKDLDAAGSGLDLAAVVIEAIHPPAGAAEAYHAVQAAQILAVTSIAAERGKALADASKASQYATAITTQAQAAAAEATQAAAADLARFAADRAAAADGRDAFLLERRLAALAQGLPKAALTVIDHRIPPDEAPTLDLRPLTAPAARAATTEQE